MGIRPALLKALKATEGLAELVDRDPLRYARWTAPQVEYLSSRARRKMLRMGNRGGKSWVALADVAYRARKRHPFRPDWDQRIGPQHQWIVGVSWGQLIPLMRLFRGFLWPGELAKEPNWSQAKGWGKDSPTLVWPDGSTVTWRTMEQRTRMHAGAAVDHCLIDEPCSDATYRELERRVVSRAGDLSLSLTPINAPGPLDWLQGLVNDQVVQDLHFRMTPDLFRFADTGDLRRLPDGTPLDQTWIDQQRREVLPRWAATILDGDWLDAAVGGLFAEIFTPDKYVSAFTLDGTEKLAIGFDHGTQGLSETAVLVAVDERGEYPSVYVLDVYEAGENSPPERDAKGVMDMLRRHGIPWRRLTSATGDIPHYGGFGKIARKSNAELAAEIAKLQKLGKHAALSPPIRQAKTGKGANPRGSVNRGLQWIYRAMQRPGHFTIHPRCKSLIDAIPVYVGGSEDPAGHVLDGLRYALDPWIRRGQTRNDVAPTLRI